MYQDIAGKFGLLDRPETPLQEAGNDRNEEDFGHNGRKDEVKRVISVKKASIDEILIFLYAPYGGSPDPEAHRGRALVLGAHS